MRKSKSFDLGPERSIGFLIRDTHREAAKILADRIQPAGISLGMWYFLRALWEQDGLTQRELSRRIGMMEPTTVNALAAMERAGLIARRRDKGDKRRRLVFLTKKGAALKDEMLPVAARVNELAVDGLTAEEVDQLRLLLGRVKSNLQRERQNSSNDNT